METYTPVRGMIICQNDTGDYVSKADFDAMREQRNDAWEKRNAAFEEVERLQDERDGLKAHASDADKAFDLYGKAQDRLAMAEALIPFTHHKLPCPFVTLLEEYKGDKYKCTCGLDEAIDSFSMVEKPDRCECGADREACKQNREKFGVHLESGCGN